MKTRILLLAACSLVIAVPPVSVPLRAAPKEDQQDSRDTIDATTQFIFYSVLEGLYEDGISNEDVAQILMKREKEAYFHFIYSCPVCNATIWALQSYVGRPDNLYGLKRESSTFGPGLSAELHDQLYSPDSARRLTAINTLVKGWMERRMTRMHLPAGERAALLERLEKKRKEGMVALEGFRKKEHGASFGVAQAAPAYVDLTECAVCNAAVGKPMKLPEAKRK